MVWRVSFYAYSNLFNLEGDVFLRPAGCSRLFVNLYQKMPERAHPRPPGIQTIQLRSHQLFIIARSIPNTS